MDFYNRIYEELKKVPKGRVTTYKILANSIGSKAYRAVGQAMKNNKDIINIPCYKVICSNGFVGNYSARGGMRRKIQLLTNDGIIVKNNYVNLRKYMFKFK
ncbi:MGMT family protein [Candidatus Woesearchaeota archaeon]|nr:MGMT family protein [Candidatus Woesearchaeota archaeon]